MTITSLNGRATSGFGAQWRSPLKEFARLNKEIRKNLKGQEYGA